LEVKEIKMFLCKKCKSPLKAVLKTTHHFKVNITSGAISANSEHTESDNFIVVCSKHENHPCGYFYDESGEIREWSE